MLAVDELRWVVLAGRLPGERSQGASEAAVIQVDWTGRPTCISRRSGA